MPTVLVEPYLNLGRSLGSYPEAIDALGRLRSAMDAHHHSSPSTSLSLTDFKQAALDSDGDEQEGTRLMMVLARLASKHPELLRLSCLADGCGQHISQSCGHISPLDPGTAILMAVEPASLTQLASRPADRKIDGVGDKRWRIIDYLVSNR